MMDFIRATVPFLYTMNPDKLLVGVVTLVFILLWIKEKSFIDAIIRTIGVGIISFIGFVIAVFLFDRVNPVDILAVILFTLIALIVVGIISSIIRAINKKVKDRRIAQEEAEKEKAFYTCDKCGKEDALQYVNTTEEDRYIGSKSVYEKTAKGNYKTRYVKCTKVVEKDHYECKFCGAGYSTKHTRELS
ncbi:hypothetical protein B0187_09740 [Haemophilus paracuniculus]|uniref:Uncharacterized protein n=1 Tax=Haemophilus paracuniculus TaxID=734 RepID=A0A1T0APU3_9PAST|nr:hypothetical protein [Haemophilus paracuniculus]OOR98072.1 hypothetical protein B0187_09740 [Haemophilus paracuniculus]